MCFSDERMFIHLGSKTTKKSIIEFSLGTKPFNKELRFCTAIFRCNDGNQQQAIKVLAFVYFRVWNEHIQGLDCGDEAAHWFSTFLKLPGLRLLFSANSCERQDLTRAKKAWDVPSQPGDQVRGHRVQESLLSVNNKAADKWLANSIYFYKLTMAPKSDV
jgi:hypothetical protein